MQNNSHQKHYLHQLINNPSLQWTSDILNDSKQQSWSYQQLFSEAISLLPRWKKLPPNAKIALLLPTHPSTLACLFSLWLDGRSVALLNITTGSQGLAQSCHLSGITHLISQQEFLQATGQNNLTTRLTSVEWLFIDLLQADLSAKKTISEVTYLINQLTTDIDDEAVILFTSGSEGVPKGVSLSHRNLLSNIDQTSKHLPFQEDERFFIALPLFHSFGLTVGCLLPLLQGFHICLFPSPLMMKAIPKAIYEDKSTILFGSGTFLYQWARNADVDDFQSLRMVIAGAEKLQPTVRSLWKNLFNIDVLEGYGVTETSPVIAVNTPEDNHIGSVGKLVIGLEARLEAVDGLAQGGRLQVRGDNVMRGYYLADRPAELTPLIELFTQDGWYDTGDLADIDEQGYLSIFGRSKRFAKIGGEMVSLEITEQLARQIYSDHQHIAVAITDIHKGEKIILLSTSDQLERHELVQQAQQQGISELAIARVVYHVESFPLLASGKPDFMSIAQLAQKFVDKQPITS